jgi:hypothetical protein
VFLFAKHFFHSTTHHHRSASGLCPGLIGLVSLTPTHFTHNLHIIYFDGETGLGGTARLSFHTPFLFFAKKIIIRRPTGVCVCVCVATIEKKKKEK